MNSIYKQKIIAQRSPLLDKMDYYENFIKDNDFTYEKMLELFSIPSIREGILFASPDLYFSIKERSGDQRKTLLTFAKYFIRMTTRATPFGLFSGVHFNKDYVKKISSQPKQFCIVDFEWLVKLINRIELNIDILYGLQVKSNQNLIVEENICTNPYLSLRYEKKEYFDNIELEQHMLSIQNTQMVKYVLAKCENFINFNDLLNDLREELKGEIPPYKIVNFLIQLINREFLYTNLRPSLPLLNPLLKVIETLEKIDTADIYVRKLKRINNLIKLYNDSEIGQGEEILISIIKCMEKFQKANKYIQIDMRLKDIESHTLEPYIPDLTGNFFKAADILAHSLDDNKIMKDYCYKFIEKYGFERRVKLLELVDTQRGIGYPLYDKNSNNNFNHNQHKVKCLINNKILESIAKKQTNINISLDEVSNLKLDILHNYVGSFDLSFNKKASIELSPLLGINPSGRVIGRFLDLADLKDEYISTYTNNFSEKDNHILEAELMVMPSNFRCGNVISRQLTCDNLIVIGSYSNKETISIQDIFVGVDQKENLYLYYQGKVLKPRISNMLNPKLCPELYRILLDISKQNSIVDSLAELYALIEPTNYTPQIKIENVTIFPEVWVVNKAILGIKGDFSFNEFLTLFEKYSNKFNIPKYFYLKEYDNTLLLCKDCSIHMEILYNEILKKNVYLTAGGKVFDEISADEIIVSYEPSEYFEISKPSHLIYPIEDINWSKRNKQVMSDWTYVKIYAKKITLKKIITNELKNFCERLIDKNYIDKYFYINYKDEKNHIRIRFHNIVSSEKVICEVNTYLTYLNTKYDIYDLSFNTYEREVERYGGEELIDITESMFYVNSKIAIDLLEIKNTETTLEDLAIIEIIYFLLKLEIGFEHIERLFVFINNKEYIKDFRTNRKKYISFYMLLTKRTYLFNQHQDKQIINILCQQDDLISEYKEKLKLESLTNSYDEIILAQLHMFCNRLFGIDRVSELKCYALVRHLFHTIEGYLKHNE